MLNLVDAVYLLNHSGYYFVPRAVTWTVCVLSARCVCVFGCIVPPAWQDIYVSSIIQVRY